jgi:hypothetical protein
VNVAVKVLLLSTAFTILSIQHFLVEVSRHQIILGDTKLTLRWLDEKLSLLVEVIEAVHLWMKILCVTRTTHNGTLFNLFNDRFVCT